jgi:hypothetical protein
VRRKARGAHRTFRLAIFRRHAAGSRSGLNPYAARHASVHATVSTAGSTADRATPHNATTDPTDAAARDCTRAGKAVG